MWTHWLICVAHLVNICYCRHNIHLFGAFIRDESVLTLSDLTIIELPRNAASYRVAVTLRKYGKLPYLHNAFIIHSSGRYPNPNGKKLYTYPNFIMDAFNNSICDFLMYVNLLDAIPIPQQGSSGFTKSIIIHYLLH